MQKSTATVKRRKSSNGKGVESGADTSFSDGHASTINSDGSSDIDVVGKTLSEKNIFQNSKNSKQLSKNIFRCCCFCARIIVQHMSIFCD